MLLPIGETFFALETSFKREDNFKLEEKKKDFSLLFFYGFISWGEFLCHFFTHATSSLLLLLLLLSYDNDLTFSVKQILCSTHSHTLSFFLYLSLSYTHTNTHTHSSRESGNLFWVKKCVDTLSLSLFLSLSNTHIHTHTHTHTHALSALQHSISHRSPLKDSLTYVAYFFTVKCKLVK